MKVSELFPYTFKAMKQRRTDSRPMWQQRQSADSDFCRAMVAKGYMSEEQMREAVGRYRLGASRDGGVIFWQIGPTGSIYDGKIMYYRADGHRDHERHPQWVSNLLKRQFLSQFPEMVPWMPESHHCLFGLHQISLADGADNADKVAVVEAEKTAVILSAHFPEYLWLAAGGLFELTADKLFPLRSHPIVLFPDTDPEGRAYARWYDVAREARHCYGCRITVSSLLERRATTAQKAAKIDLADLLFENKPQ